MGQMNFGNDQLRAIKMAREWFKSGDFLRKPIFVIGGYAGTGKSTVLNQVLCELNIPNYKVAYVTYTGKAAVVLRKKGLNAITIHKLIYRTMKTSSSGKPSFKLKKHIPPNIELICIDELGMVPNNMMLDIMTFHVPILGLGDPGQLPPVFGENVFIKYSDVFLSEVFRQSSDSSLLKAATDIRNHIDLYSQKYHDDVKIFNNTNFKGDILEYDQILCSSNKNRRDINVKCRELMGIKSKIPIKGEKVICQMNNFNDSYSYESNIEVCLVNGLTGVLLTDAVDIGQDVVFFMFGPEGMPGLSIPVIARKDSFEDNYESWDHVREKRKQGLELKFYGDKIVNDFDFGYCITVHKSQGSEWPNVLVYDDCFYHNKSDYERWLYTAVTRARKEITVVKYLD